MSVDTLGGTLHSCLPAFAWLARDFWRSSDFNCLTALQELNVVACSGSRHSIN